MNYPEFFAKFGAALRSKHCGKRGFALPSNGALPRDFIRLDPWEAEYLWGVAKRSTVGILEIGRFNGGSTFLLAAATPTIPIMPVVSIDLAPRDDALLRRYFSENDIDNVELIVGDSRQARPEPTAVDLLFIDGDHSYEGCAADIAAWHDRVVPGGSIVFHDSYQGSYGVQRAVTEFFANAHSTFEIVTSPVIPADHWTRPHGSIAHLRKLA